MRRALVVCDAVLGVLLLGSAAWGDIHAVAKPETQTVAINGTAASFDGSKIGDMILFSILFSATGREVAP